MKISLSVRHGACSSSERRRKRLWCCTPLGDAVTKAIERSGNAIERDGDMIGLVAIIDA